MSLGNIPSDILLNICDRLRANDIHNLITTCRRLKEDILLNKYRYKHFIASHLPQVQPYLFNLRNHKIHGIVSSEQQSHRLSLLTGEFRELLDVPNCILAGGSVVELLDSRVSDLELKQSTTDLDIFVYNSSFSNMGDQLKQLLSYLERFKPYYFQRNNVIEVLIPKMRRIQIVFSECENPYHIVANFDMGYCQLFVQKNTCYGTHVAVAALRDKHTTLTTNKVSPDRVQKAQKKGFSVQVNKDTVYNGPSNTNVRNRFLLEHVKIEMDAGKLDLPIMKTLDREINVASILEDMKPWKGLYGTITETQAVNYTQARKVCIKPEKGRSCTGYSLTEYVVYHDFSELLLRTGRMKVVGSGDILFFESKYEEPKRALYVHEGPFSRYCEDVQEILQQDYGHVFRSRKGEDRYENQWLKVKIKGFTDIVDIFGTPYHEPIKANDMIMCEVMLKDYQIRSRRTIARGGRPTVQPGYFSVVAKKIIVM